MAYIDSDYIKARVDDSTLGKLTKEKGGSSPDESLIASKISDAEVRVNSSIGNRYDVPLTTVPDKIKQITFDIALYLIYRTHRTHKMDEEIKWAYERALKELDRIEDGRTKLIGVSELNSSPTKIFAKTYGTPNLRFGKEFLEGR